MNIQEQITQLEKDMKEQRERSAYAEGAAHREEKHKLNVMFRKLQQLKREAACEQASAS